MEADKPSARAVRALRKLEDALGWRGRPSLASAPETLEAFKARASTARSSAGLADLLAPEWQARAIRKALEALKSAERAGRS